MRIAVLSDIHGNLAALEAVTADLRRRGVDLVCNLGDSLSGPLLPRETARFLMAQNWTHVAGNHERQLLDMTSDSSKSDLYAHSQLSPTEMAWIGSLPNVAHIDNDILLCHGTPGSDIIPLLENADRPASHAEIGQRLGEVSTQVVLCGHTHLPRSVRYRQTLIVNPGSVGLQAFAGDRPYPHVIENGSPDARYAILEKKDAIWTVALLTVPYAHQSMASLAGLRDFHAWQCALSTGYVSLPDHSPPSEKS